MDALRGAYEDSDSEDAQSSSLPQIKEITSLRTAINVAPDVGIVQIYENKVDPHSKKVLYNPTYEALWTPVQGAAKAFDNASLLKGAKNHLTGFVEDHNMNDFAFEKEYYTFHNYGHAVNPGASGGTEDGQNIIVSRNKVGDVATNLTVFNTVKRDKKRRAPAGDPLSVEGYQGPWASYEQREEDIVDELTDEQRQTLAEAASAKKKQRAEAKDAVDEEGCTSVFHGKQLKDYLGRSYVDHPTDLKASEHAAFLPKKWVHTWSGHTAAVSCIRFFPTYGHILLSAGMDNQVKIWDVYNDRKCLRTFSGHQKAVRDVCWSKDGRRFVSCGYDRTIKLWDSETGQCITSMSNGKIPYCVNINPDEDKQHLLLAGGSDKKIIQWDMHNKKIVQEYDQHLGAVNTITYVDNNRRFVTSSDDKSLRVWEFGIPVVIKYISEPHMHSMPAVSLHPSGGWIGCQSLDNQILIYSTKDRFKLHRKKRFMGHTVAGFACKPNFSPDGRFVMSGDGDGRLWFWDWKSGKMLKTLKCHDKVTIDCEWHPIEPSKVATCSWDGSIKYWD